VEELLEEKLKGEAVTSEKVLETEKPEDISQL
jgi:hypothetical protein